MHNLSHFGKEHIALTPPYSACGQSRGALHGCGPLVAPESEQLSTHEPSHYLQSLSH